MGALTPLPHTKLMEFLKKQPMGSGITWCDYWRGFWDATRSLRKDPGPLLGAAINVRVEFGNGRKEYANGYARGDLAYKAARFRRITKGK